MAYLSHRSRTSGELLRHLTDRGHAPAESAAALDRLRELGYIDDRAYAQRFAARAAGDRPMGRARVVRELLRKGLTRDTIDSVLEAAFGPDVETAALDRALRRAIRGIRPEAVTTGRRRVASRLLRLGFAPSLVRGAVERWSGGAWPAPEGDDAPFGTEDEGESEA